jgi:BirA family transcriptional regulator, biotin operon repressor / biotin---[acetyl-CoA-carboxylase] ligase
MNIIKVNATDSTNSFLMNLAKQKTLGNFTIVTTEVQSKGRGQMHTKWHSESGKNLIFSVLVRVGELEVENQFYLSYAVSLAVFNVLTRMVPSKIEIKWPNDILAGNRKICGVLIENSIQKKYIKQTIVGIGLNVNQENFSKELPNAISMKQITGKNYDRKGVLEALILELKTQIGKLEKHQYEQIKNDYLNQLYKKQVPTMFKDSWNQLFLGKIIGISSNGKLQIELEDETVKEFGLKEISIA